MEHSGETARGGSEGQQSRPVVTWQAPRGMIQLSVFNYVMRIITLGIYHFWGKTEVRRRIWSAIRINGEPLTYGGLGKELFLGMAIVVGVVFVPMFLASLAGFVVFGPTSRANDVLALVLYALVFFLFGIGLFRAQRYRLSRTLWRGVRGGVDGTGWDYAWTYFWTGLLVPLTLGWIIPWRTVALQRMLTNRMRFGNHYFSLDAGSSHLYRRFPLVWFGGLLVTVAALAAGLAYLGVTERPGSLHSLIISWIDVVVLLAIAAGAYLIYLVISSWYRAQTFNYLASRTTISDARFSGTMRARGLAWLSVSNYLMVLLSLGVLVPIAQMRSARYMVENLAFVGAVDFDGIAQVARDQMRLGEGMAQAFDVDAF